MWLLNLLKSIVSMFSAPSPEPQKTILPSEVNVPAPDVTTKDTTYLNDKTFNEALTLILKYEGGYSNRPADKGGPTNKGITQINYDSYRKTEGKELRSVELIQDDEVKDLYYKNYWSLGKCSFLPANLAIVHFDTCVNCGWGQASKFLQRAIPVPADGIIGPKTIAALNYILKSTKEINIIHSYLEQRSNFYYALVEKDPSQKVFITGWQERVTTLTAYIDTRNDGTALA